jgi:hypothetical protein
MLSWNIGLQVHPSSLEWLQARFGISLLYLKCIVDYSKWAKAGNACFPKYNESGQTVKIGA